MKGRVKTQTTQLPSYTFRVERLSHEGRGIARYSDDFGHPVDKQGKNVFITQALVGETVRAQLTHQSKKLDEAELIEVLGTTSAERVEPVCPHFTKCGGCTMQHMSGDMQIELKQQTLQSHLLHFAQLTPETWLDALRSPRLDYRHKARIGVRYLAKQKQLVMGFREAKSNHLTPIKTCKVLDKELDQALPALHQLLKQLQGCADIGHIELSKGTTETALLVRHTADLVAADLQALCLFAQQRSWQLYLQAHDINSVKRIDQPQAESRLHYHLGESTQQLTLAFHPTDFIQVNPAVNQKMVKLACELLDLKEGESVLDLFCGLGNFSLPLAQAVGESGRVVAVEGSEAMVRRGAENAKRNKIGNLKFYTQDLTKDFSKFPWVNQGFDALLIDPPRSGAELVMHYLHHFNAKRIVYVSCNPATLARDAGILVKHGYQLKKAGVIDMFPYTGHVESITLFEKLTTQSI